jgi:predicted Zn finger-like uncharacterized protein
MSGDSPMHIICPDCTTTYAIELHTLGHAGRTVRCSRCKRVWLARPEDVRVSHALVPSAADDGASGWGAATVAAETNAGASFAEDQMPPVVESPSISAELPSGPEIRPEREVTVDAREVKTPARRRRSSRPRRGFAFRLPAFGLGTGCAAMGALALALMVWRADVVRLLPQTAAFYRLVGAEVNLRGLTFKDVKVSSETVEGKPVLVVEGVIVGEAKKPVELPRLRFSVRDAQGAEIYAWNALLEQPVLKPGEKAWFKSRLASPPAEGRAIDVRFFNKRDVAAGGA